ncbi:MAG: hypothetical protein WA397_21945, partial [Roseiarcus sp.]
ETPFLRAAAMIRAMKPWSPAPCTVGGSRTIEERTPRAIRSRATVSEKDLFGPVGTWLSRSVETLPWGKEKNSRRHDQRALGAFETGAQSLDGARLRFRKDSQEALDDPTIQDSGEQSEAGRQIHVRQPVDEGQVDHPVRLGGALAQQRMIMKPPHARLAA